MVRIVGLFRSQFARRRYSSDRGLRFNRNAMLMKGGCCPEGRNNDIFRHVFTEVEIMGRPKYSIVVVHGISDKTGDQQKGFSIELAKQVFPDPICRERFWHEAVWEPVNDKLDDKFQDVVLQLVNTYEKTTYWRDAELKKAKSLWRRLCIRVKAGFWWVVEKCLMNKITRALDLALDLPMYLGDPKGERIRATVKDTIEQALKRTDEGVVLVGHSLGSVIAFDVMQDLFKEKGEDCKIKALVTMGSPLGWVTELKIADKEIKDEEIRTALPWFNFYDIQDPVPLMTGLSECRFLGVQNLPPISSGEKYIDAHVVYWRRPEVAELISRLMVGEFGSAV